MPYTERGLHYHPVLGYRQRKPKPHKILRVTGGRVAYTNTSKVPDRFVEEAIRFVAKHVDMNKVIVHVKASAGRSRDGSCYANVPDIANTEGLRRGEWRNLITMRGRPNKRGFVELLAHEAKHVEQFRHYGWRKGVRGWEDACHAFQHWVGEKWQATQPEGGT